MRSSIDKPTDPAKQQTEINLLDQLLLGANGADRLEPSMQQALRHRGEPEWSTASKS